MAMKTMRLKTVSKWIRTGYIWWNKNIAIIKKITNEDTLTQEMAK